jgi:hypothetical protein
VRTRQTRLVYIYGPPAVGKLTVAEALARQTGYRLFHNHVTVNAIREVFDFRSPAFVEVSTRLRLDVFATAMRHGVDLIFTNNSAWRGFPPEAFLGFVQHAREVTIGAGGTFVLVRLTASMDALESRVDAQSRHQHGKLVDRERLLSLLAETGELVAEGTALTIDTSDTSPDDAAAAITAVLAR